MHNFDKKLPMSSQVFTDLVGEMMLALRANIEYLKNNGSSQVTIKNGKLSNVLENGYIYDFEIGRLQDFDEEADIEVKIGQQNIAGKVIASADNTVTVILDGYVGDTIASGVLIISNYFLLERLYEHLSGIKEGERDYSKIAEKILKQEVSTVALDESFTSTDLNQNESQTQSIQLALGSEVTFIWGPPGTGKSETIAHLIEGLINKGLNTLLIAHTNAATDSVMLKVVEWMEAHDDYLNGKFLRVGSLKTIAKELLPKKVIPERIMEEKAKPIHDAMEIIQKEIDDNNRKLRDYNLALNKKAELDKHKVGIKRAKDYIADKSTEIFEISDSAKSEQQALKDLDERILDFQRKGGLSKLFAGTNLQKLTHQKTYHLQQITNLKTKQEHATNLVKQAKLSLAEMEQTLSQIKEDIDNLNIHISEAEAKRIQINNKECAEQLNALQKELSELANKLILEAKVIATTLTKSYMHKQLLAREYDCVVLDEASMAPLPAVVAAAALAKKKVVIVGDFFQLPPIAKHKIDARRKTDEEAAHEKYLIDKWLKKDIFNFVNIDEDIRKNKQPDAWLTQLNTQYRMHPDISALVNELVYEHYNPKFKLLNGDNTKKNGLKLLAQKPLQNAHLGVYDTGAFGPIATKSDSGSWFNLTHALTAVEMAKQALKSGYTEIGIISAYRAQINLIQKILKDEIPNDLDKVAADTVHRFQGGAKEIIIFDVTTTQSNSMYDDAEEGGDDEKLINVAFSRAKDKCIILADVNGIKRNHSNQSLILGAIKYCEAHNHPVVNAKPLLNDFAADDRTDMWLASLNNVDELYKQIDNAKLFDQSDFYPNYIRDLLKAEKEVIIQSAFITSRRSETLKPIFHRLIQKGVRIYVLTRVTWEHDGLMREQAEDELKQYEKMGIFVIPFVGKIHQKYSVIDRKILWDGSLNILSQRDSQEVMRRYTGKEAVEQYLSFQRIEKNIGKLGENRLKHCDVCTLPGSWFWTKKVRGRMWTFCLTGVHSAGQEPRPQKDKATKSKEKETKLSQAAAVRAKIKQNTNGQLLCPVHNRILLEKKGRFGQYWECPNSKECACTINPNQLKKLLGAKAQATLDV